MMIRETELNLLVPSPELLVRLASQDKPLGISAGPPRIRFLRETYFDTPEETLRRRGMTCKLRQGQGEDPSIVVTVGEGPDSEGITSRSRLTAAAVGFGIFETLRGSSEVAAHIQKIIDPSKLRPQISLDIQRLGRLHRSGILRRPTLFLYFDRITIQAGGGSSLLHEIRIRRRRPGGPLIRELGQKLRDEFHLFPDGLSTLQRAHRILSMEQKSTDSDLPPYALGLVLALFRDGRMGLVQRGEVLGLPSFRGSGEDAARALASDLTGTPKLSLQRIGSTESRQKRPVVEVWVAPDCGQMEQEMGKRGNLVWYPWHALLELVGRGGIRDPDLLSALLLLTRRRLSGRLEWVPPYSPEEGPPPEARATAYLQAGEEGIEGEILAVDALVPTLRAVEKRGSPLESRLVAVQDFMVSLREIFTHRVRALKEKILSSEDPARESDLILLLDLISVRVRGLVDRVYQVVAADLLPQLESRGIHLRKWNQLMREDRRALMEVFSERQLPNLQVVSDWGPAFVPEMPPTGCAVGVTARSPGSAATRFFHVVLDEDTPSFLTVPGSTVVLPLEEVIRGYLFSQYPELERSETFLFRFRTAEVKVRKVYRLPIVTPAPDTESASTEEEPGDADSDSVAERPGEVDPASVAEGPGRAMDPGSPASQESASEGPTLPETLVRESTESLVIHVVVHRDMPETHQAQLLRALERQVARRSPLIGWCDLYPVDGPLDLAGLRELLTGE